MFDLSAPMKGCVLNQGRYLFLEGDLKFKDNIGKVRENVLFFEDVRPSARRFREGKFP